MSLADADIVYTHTDEAPALATASLLPIIRAFTAPAGVRIAVADISLAGRILAAFPEAVPDGHAPVTDALTEMGRLAGQPSANLIKLPNISASIPQLNAAIAELQGKGYDVPDYPAEPDNDEQASIKARYGKVLGSAVNPVLREGNSDRRVADAVKNFAQSHPHSMGSWAADRPTRVASMDDGDFFGSEQSHVMEDTDSLSIEHVASDGTTTTLRPPVAVERGEVVDAARMSVAKLRKLFEAEFAAAKSDGVLASVHLKATMMKVSDPIIFGHAVSVLLGEGMRRHADDLDRSGFNPNNGIGSLEASLATLPPDVAEAIRGDVRKAIADGPDLAMVDSDRGITNLHVPSDVIIDASMPAAIRSGGQMWGPDGQLHPMVAIIPDRCYAGVYQTTIDFCREHGAFDPASMGTVNNVGLMAKKAEEYGSHDKTFEIPSDGRVFVRDQTGRTIFEHDVAAGDIWRMCQTKDVAIRDWVGLAVRRARQTGWPAVFWLDEARAHDANLIRLVRAYLSDLETEGLDLQILAPAAATRHACQRAAAGENTISVTGNVLRDYLTDLFPILELGTSAKMLSIVPLLAGGGLYETGAGGSAPKHVQQFVEEGHLRWDSLGEFLALAVSLEDLADRTKNPTLAVIARGLNAANDRMLADDRSPGRKVGQLDTRGSHFHLAKYWAGALAEQPDAPKVADRFRGVAERLAAGESAILGEIDATQGSPIELDGYYMPGCEAVVAAMRPSETFNQAIDGLAAV